MFIKFLHMMWNKKPAGKYSWDKDVYSPAPLQRAIGKINDMFKGSMQNDTNEFIACLLNTIHEDLNRVIKKPKIIMPNSFKMLDYSDEML